MSGELLQEKTSRRATRMEYFKHFPRVDYKFGDDFEKLGGGDAVFEITHDITSYIDIIDRIKEISSYYTTYTILENDRPDIVSQKIYGSPAYHWTFYIMNDKIREQGWPLTYKELENKVKKDFPHKYIETRQDLTGIFLPGERVVASQSNGTGDVVRRHLMNGIIIVDSENSFLTGETVTTATYTGITSSINVRSTGYEYNAPRYYIDGNGERVDIDPAIGPGALLTEVTNYDFYNQENEALKTIRVLRPDVVNQVVGGYFKSLKVV